MFIGYSTEDMSPVWSEIGAIYPKKALSKMFELEIFGDKEKFNFLVVRKDLSVSNGLYRKNFD